MGFQAKSLRLTQFWRLRFERMLRVLPNLHGKPPHPLLRAEFFEAVGWLAEGVFCGYFNPFEANVVLVLIAPLRDSCGKPEIVPGGSLTEKIWGLEWSQDPFRESLQMTDGPQKHFELPLFGHALLLADRFFNDRIVDQCTQFMYLDDQRWAKYKKAWPLVDATRTDNVLNGLERAAFNLQSVSAGYIRLLEHMDLSQHFFDYAKSQSGGRDFESYVLRVGGLNGWRIPLDNSHLRSRFYELSDLFEFTVRPPLKKQYPDVEWSILSEPLGPHVKRLASGWESFHLLGSLVAV